MLAAMKDPGGLQFRLEDVAATCTTKTYESTDRPAECFIELTFAKSCYLSHIMFQNFYTYAITIKQAFPEETKPGKKWRTVLRNYKLMKNPHFEGDAQNWHLIKTDKVFSVPLLA